MRQNDLQTLWARDLRQSLTEAERILWVALRDRRFKGLKFRRQVPIGPYVVDFLCAEKRLIVEAVGGSLDAPSHDPLRDQWLNAQGFTVVWLSDPDIRRALPGCLQRLAETVAP
jgi:very-short-patch-repair endonuclease